MLSVPCAPLPGLAVPPAPDQRSRRSVFVREALAETALGAVVEVEPVAGGELLDILVVAAAIGGGDRCAPPVAPAVADGGLDKAARHVDAARAVTDLGCAAEDVVAIKIVAAVVEVDVESRTWDSASTVLSAEKPWMGENTALGRRVTSAMVEEP